MDTQERNTLIAKLIADGMSLGDVQKTLEAEHGVKMTYMDLRLLSSELSVDWSKQDAAIQATRPKEKEEPQAPAPTPVDPMDPASASPEADGLDEEYVDAELEDDEDDLPQEEPTTTDDDVVRGQTTVNISKLARPGAVMHGDVTFGSGAKAEWFLDQLGRLALNPTEGSEKPDDQDIKEFQMELQRAVQSQMGGMGGMM